MLGIIFKSYWGNKSKYRSLYSSYFEESQFSISSSFDDSKGVDIQKLKSHIVEEGAEGYAATKTRKRSSKLVNDGRKHFRNKDSENKLRCAACGFVKSESIKREIIQLHHKEMISEIDSNGQSITLDKAIRNLLPLCPTCHQIAHSSKPPLSVDAIKKLIGC
jgi:predicted HNH restriction endonuclease